ncbi:MAG: hypothetical protein E6772_04520 [Dysgonomonas sp.]|nr:hypothetical protein [Dysgonomonas sp.]
MNYKVFLSALFSLITLSLQAQVTIGLDKKAVDGALLQIKNKEVTNPVSVTDVTNATVDENGGGIALPRVHLVSKTTLQPFVANDADFTANTDKIKEKHAGLMVYNLTTTGDFAQGIYTWNGSEWKGENTTQDRFFYMPSFNLPITAISQNNYYPIYPEYQAQFTKAGLPIYPSTEIEFRITHYDASVIDNISFPAEYDNLYMKYDVVSTTAPAGSFMNIIIVVK